MPFQLEVQFTGLCLYVLHTNEDRAKVFLVHARKARHGDPTKGADMMHPDGEKGEPHAGFMLFNLGALDSSLPSNEGSDGPDYEVIHRFDFEDVLFPQLQAAAMTVNAVLPDLARIHGGGTPKPDLFQPTPSDRVLARIDIKGGNLLGASATGTGECLWKFDHVHNATNPYQDHFTSVVNWVRQVDDDHLQVRLRPFDRTLPATDLRLRPIDGVVRLKVGNLCSLNPLEWDELNLFGTKVDNDFKWHYRLLDNVCGGHLHGQPIPSAIEGPLSAQDDCLGMRASFAYSDID